MLFGKCRLSIGSPRTAELGRYVIAKRIDGPSSSIEFLIETPGGGGYGAA